MFNLRIRYNNLTQFEKEVICNGCGPKGLFWKPPQFRFKASCNHHDFQYWLGCNKQQRKKADLQFLLALLEDVRDFYGPGLQPKYKKIALAYYSAVRVFGMFCFHWGRKQRNRIDLDRKVELALRKKG
jgi:hypothetical protein